MSRFKKLIGRLGREEQGAMAIETAIVAPVLILMAVGSFQISSMVARQSELQSAVAEAAAIGLASPPENQSDLDTVSGIMQASADLEEDDVTVTLSYRCGSNSTRVSDPSTCAAGVKVWTYMTVTLEAPYSPFWTKLGVGSDVDLTVDRTVQIS
ncbi:MAG: pilus assembly protein [Novosphingobium sp.]|nr:pilus assembly protein [Novosphingobium sp.]